MVTDQYSHILDDDRRKNVALFEDAFYAKKGIEEEPTPEPPAPEKDSGLDMETLAKLASSPELSVLLKILAKNI